MKTIVALGRLSLRYVYYMDMKSFVNELDGVFLGEASSAECGILAES